MSTSSASRMRIIKILLSVFLLYHLATVTLMPIGGSLVGRRLARYFVPYASTLGFNTTWQFFSPAPSPMYYLKYDVELADGSDAVGPDGGWLQYPPARRPFAWDDGWNRRLYGMRFFTLHQERLERFFIPFLCRITPGARRVRIQPAFAQIENIERVGNGTDEYADFSDMAEKIDMPRESFTCPETNAIEPVAPNAPPVEDPMPQPTPSEGGLQ